MGISGPETESLAVKTLTRTEQIIQGLTILSKYSDNEIAAEHDILYAGPAYGDTVSDEDKATLETLGWHIDSGTETWARFV